MTAEGFEELMGVNHLGTFLVTRLLLDRLRTTHASRIVFVTGELHRHCGQIDFERDFAVTSRDPDYSPIHATMSR